jgi:hypothetical protein
MRYCNCSKAQCKGQSDTSPENSTDAPRAQHRNPLAASERTRRYRSSYSGPQAAGREQRVAILAELRARLAAPTFQARLRAGEQGEQP